MKSFLRYSLVALLAMAMGKLSAQEVTLDFTLADTDAENSTISVWGFPVGSSNKTVDEQSFTYGGYTVKVAGSTGQGYYWHNSGHYLLFGKQGATVTLPAFSFDVQRIEIEGNSAASASVLQNIYVGEAAVSTETTGAQGTNKYDIAADYQAAGNVYVIKVNSAHNSQIKTIKIWKKGTVQEEDVPEAENIAAFTALGNGTEAVLKLEGAKVTYVSPDGKSVYVRDATGGMCFYNQAAFAGATNKWVLGGSVKGKVSMRNGMTQMTVTDGSALTHTEEAEYVPVAVTMSEVKDHVADLIQLTEDFTVTDVSGKFYNNEDKDVQLYDNFRLGYTVNDGDVLKDLTGVVILYNQQVEIAPTLEPTIVTPPALILTLKATVGEEVSVRPGVYAEFDIFSVDFGDGVLVTDSVGHENKGVCVNDGTDTWPQKEGTTHTGITEFKGTATGDGTIKVYGNSDLWYLAVSGAIPATFDQEKLKKVVQMTVSKVAVDAIDLKGLDDLKIFGFSQGSLKSINVKDNAALTNLTINNNTASAFPSVLESLDLSGNANLEQLNVMAASAANPGILASLDLSNNPKLANVYAQYNALTSVVLPTGASLSFLNLQDNQLQRIDLSVVESFKDSYLNNNQLTAVDLSKLKKGANLYLDGNQLTEVEVPVEVKNLQLNKNQLTKVTIVGATASCKVENNLLTLATIPSQPAGMNTSSKTKKFTYAPQAALQVDETVAELDLSAQASVEKGELNSSDYATWLSGTTTFSFVTESGATLAEDTDYEVTAPGKFKFLKGQAEKVHAVMLNTAFPKFTAAAPFVTTAFTIPTTVGIHELNAASATGKMYNLQGVEVMKADKGLYIRNGKKVIVK